MSVFVAMRAMMDVLIVVEQWDRQRQAAENDPDVNDPAGVVGSSVDVLAEVVDRFRTAMRTVRDA